MQWVSDAKNCSRPDLRRHTYHLLCFAQPAVACVHTSVRRDPHQASALNIEAPRLKVMPAKLSWPARVAGENTGHNRRTSLPRFMAPPLLHAERTRLVRSMWSLEEIPVVQLSRYEQSHPVLQSLGRVEDLDALQPKRDGVLRYSKV
jgi:hypothetical protein